MVSNFSVVNFYRGKSILITGGTGFVGKVIIEKILRICKNIDKIHVLVRGHDSCSPEERINAMVDSPLFESLRKAYPDRLKKIIAIRGDIAQSNLGIHPDQERLLLDKVSVVIHSAATVKFDEKLDVSTKVNYGATKTLLKMCQRMKNLECFVHISTAFTVSHQDVCDETVYPAPTTVEKLEQFLQGNGMQDKEQLNEFLGSCPNTYIFTKALAENYIAQHHGDIPTVIVRPSAVTASHKDPNPGFLDSWSAQSAIMAAMMLGYPRVIHADKNASIDLIPVDIVANAVIVAAAKSASSKKLKIYNVATSWTNPLTFKNIYDMTTKFMIENNLSVLPLPYTIITKNERAYLLLSIIFEKIPAAIADRWLMMRGKKPKYVKLYEKLSYNQHVAKRFMTKDYKVRNTNTLALAESLSPEESKVFPCDPRAVVWNSYMPDNCKGIYAYILKEKRNSLIK